METIPLSHIFYTQRLKVPGINNFSRTKSLKSLLCFHILIVSHRLPKSHAFTQTTIFHYIFNRFFPIFLTDKLHPVIFYSMIIGNTVHFIHLAYPTDIVTDIRNYNHFNPKELNPILKLAICEDNPSHYEIIHTILQKYPPGAFEITHFASGDEFLRTVAENGCPYSIVLTDIDLGSDNVNGISLAEKINYISPDTQIIFISQYLQYATAVYETEHAYFIHKQQMEKYLPLALRTACQKLEKLHTRYLYFSGNSRNYQVLCSDILYLERNLRQTTIYTRTGTYTTKERLTALTERMKPDFCLCHNSFAVNLHAVRTYSHKGIILFDNTEIPVSRSYYQQFKDAFAFMMLASHREVQ